MQQVQAGADRVAGQQSVVVPGGPGLKLPAGRLPDTAAELDGSDITAMLLSVDTPKKRPYGRGNPRYPAHDAAVDYLPESCQGAGCLAAQHLAAFAESCSLDRGCREVFGFEPKGQEA